VASNNRINLTRNNLDVILAMVLARAGYAERYKK
jgi:hypothetical protein